jgi:hypothetical protein
MEQIVKWTEEALGADCRGMKDSKGLHFEGHKHFEVQLESRSSNSAGFEYRAPLLNPRLAGLFNFREIFVSVRLVVRTIARVRHQVSEHGIFGPEGSNRTETRDIQIYLISRNG